MAMHVAVAPTWALGGARLSRDVRARVPRRALNASRGDAPLRNQRNAVTCSLGLNAQQPRQASRVARPTQRSRVRAQAAESANSGSVTEAELAVLDKLRNIIDPDFGQDIVACGFIKNLEANVDTGVVKFDMELTTPACPIKDEFERQAREYVAQLDWVKEVDLTMTAQPVKPLIADDMPAGLKGVRHVIAVSSCKGGVGKSTVSVNLAYSLAMMGAKVGIFDADVYGPSLPTMISPEQDVLMMDPETKMISPVEYEGVSRV
eukprot:CAMPEP_0118923686 /NCGR_PEP_ID=MMETSP1169-20130426/2116_1 /TAXON_ID=36882 /ORGANISM="Pyramimonas obovata, Strain CCMP722" /LENGTH=261 /DNA_ID=CAMNT_0006864703 /DNA_START=98 /DNA_END=880 /DNA_ORIENTATION=+